MRADRAPTRKPARRFEPWPWLLTGLLAAMIASSLCLLSIASAHPDGLVVADAWTAGLAYNDAVAAERAAEDAGLELDVATRETGTGVRVEARIAAPGEPTNAGAGPDALQVSVRRLRPAESGYDADFALAPGSGGFSADVPLPLAGRWRLVVTAERGDALLRRQVDLWRAGGRP